MSKRRRNRNKETTTAETTPVTEPVTTEQALQDAVDEAEAQAEETQPQTVEELVQSVAAETQVPEEPAPEVPPEEPAPAEPAPAEPAPAVLPELPAPAVEVQEPVEVPEAPAEPVPEPAPAPAAEPAVPETQPAQPTERKPKVMAEDIYPTQTALDRRLHGKRPTIHTARGNKLIKLFGEYRMMMEQKLKGQYDKASMRDRAAKLLEIFNTACPRITIDQKTAADLVRITFDAINDGWGTVYSDSTLFRMDYSLPTPGDIDRVDMFFTAIIQMVEGVAQSRTVMFDRTRLQQVINNEAIVSAMCQMRDGINRYALQVQKEYGLA